MSYAGVYAASIDAEFQGRCERDGDRMMNELGEML